jgi:hypothetical protein
MHSSAKSLQPTLKTQKRSLPRGAARLSLPIRMKSALTWFPPLKTLGALILGGTVALGCTNPTDEGAGAESDTSRTQAFVTIERGVDYTGVQPQTKAQASARFLRSTAESSLKDAAELLGAAYHLPKAGSCISLDEQGTTLPTLSPVELLHVGDVSIEAGERETELRTRAYPDVAHLVSGVMYTSPGIAADGFPHQNPMTLHVSGSSEVIAYDVQFQRPELPQQVNINGQSLEKGTSTSFPLQVTWAEGRENESYFVDVSAYQTGQTQRWRCQATNGGHQIVLPSTLVPNASSLTITLHRVQNVKLEGSAHTNVQVDGWVMGTVSLNEN